MLPQRRAVRSVRKNEKTQMDLLHGILFWYKCPITTDMVAVGPRRLRLRLNAHYIFRTMSVEVSIRAVTDTEYTISSLFNMMIRI